MAKKSHIGKWITGIIFLILFLFGLYLYKIVTSTSNIQKYVFIYIYPSMNVKQLADTLVKKRVIAHPLFFRLLAKEMKLNTLKPGKYRITTKMSMPAIIRLFRSGKDEKISIYIHSKIYYYDDFINALDKKLMGNRQDIQRALQTHASVKEREWMNKLFIKSYKFNWASDLRVVLDSILQYYQKVWNQERRRLLKRTSLSEKEAMILASIVQNESHIYSEQRKIAGVYINRLNKQMPLQADPTLKYIHHKMKANRIYYADKELDSPYNTYKYKGLPPSTLGAVSVQALDAVLNYEVHPYFYFCAKPELNGYSNYSETYTQHLKYARQYRQKLDLLNIK